ncbi:E3 ubiquitin-protein ligase rbbp6 [Linnemannia zychae]|nr:E3 ubiquitin-protein ligase rbbp6 [Linnemannia zychae]
MSKVHYKFKSSKDYDSATFDGHSISVFDLKKEILIAKGLKGPDDLALTHAETGEEYYDDAALIPRNTSILVARVPAKPGRGGAQRYLEGAGPIPRGGNMTRNVFEKPSANSQDSAYRNTTSLLPEEGPPAETIDMSNMTEEEKMKFVFEQQTSHWGKTQEGMAHAQFRPLSKFQGATRNQPQHGPHTAGSGAGSHPGTFTRTPMEQQQRPPPNTYVCYRCGKKGEHWIQFCPTNNDKSFEPIGIKKTTGIPQSFLKTVKSDTLQSKKGVMVTQDGNLVVATTNDHEWKKFYQKSKGTLTSDEAYNTAPVPDDMKCPICHLLLKNAVKAPCCGTNFCDECIRNYLVNPTKGEESFKCFTCHKYLVPDQLIPNVELRQRVEHHLRDWAKSRRMETDGHGDGAANPDSRSGSPSMDTDKTEGQKLSDDTNTSLDGEGSGSAGQKRRLSNDNNQATTGSANGDHDRDQPSWKNKRPHVNNHGNNNYFNNQGMNRNRPPFMHGPGPMGPMDPNMMDPNLMFPDGIPPGFFEMMQQHDPTLFMDPNMFGPNGVPQFMMPGFVPPFMPEFGGMPGQGGPGGPGGPEMWNMGRGIPGLPPMGPGYPTPRIGFSEPGAGRGRGRGGGWQENNQSGQGGTTGSRGRGNPQSFSQNGPQGGSTAGSNVNSSTSTGAAANATRGSSIGRDNNRDTNDNRNNSQNSQGRFDDDIDMSQVPTGPRGARSPSIEDEDIPKGPRAGPGPIDDRERSESPPTAPLADRLKYRSNSGTRSEKATDNNSIGSSSDRDRSRQNENRHDRQRRDRSKDNSREDESDINDHSSSRNDRETSIGTSSRNKSVDPQRDYEMKRQASFGSSKPSSSGIISLSRQRQQEEAKKNYEENDGNTFKEDDDQEVVSFRRRPGQQQDSQKERGYGRRNNDHRVTEEDDRIHFRKRGGDHERTQQQQMSRMDLPVTGLISQSARERERAERERRGQRD